MARWFLFNICYVSGTFVFPKTIERFREGFGEHPVEVDLKAIFASFWYRFGRILGAKITKKTVRKQMPKMFAKKIIRAVRDEPTN